MKKKIILVVAAAMLVVMLAPAAFAAVNDQQKEEINKLYQQMFDLKRQIIDKYIEGGEITKEQGEYYKKNLDYMQKYQSEYGYGMMGPGGCGGAGYGMMGGSGMMGGYGQLY